MAEEPKLGKNVPSDDDWISAIETGNVARVKKWINHNPRCIRYSFTHILIKNKTRGKFSRWPAASAHFNSNGLILNS